MGDAWIYSAVLWSIMAGMFGVAVGVRAVRKILARDNPPRAAPVLLWLVGAMACVALATGLEQGRVLIYRLSYDGWIDRSRFDAVYDFTALVAGSKILAAVAIAGSAGVMLALMRGKPDADALDWGAAAGLLTAMGWLLLALALIPLT